MFANIVYYICIATYYVTYWGFIISMYVLDLLKYPLHPYMLALFAIVFSIYKLKIIGTYYCGKKYATTTAINIVFHAETLDGHAAAWVFGEGAPVTVPNAPVKQYIEVSKPGSIINILPITEMRDKIVAFVDIRPSIDELVQICNVATKVIIFSSTERIEISDKKLEKLILTGALTYHIDQTKTGSLLSWEYAHKGCKMPTILAYVVDITQRTFALTKSPEIAAYLNHNVPLYTFAEIANKKLATIDDIKRYYTELTAPAPVMPKVADLMRGISTTSANSFSYFNNSYYISPPPPPPPPPQPPKRPRLEKPLYQFVKMAEDGNKYLKHNKDVALTHNFIKKQIKINTTTYTAIITVTINSFAEVVGEYLLSTINDTTATNTFVAIACYDVENVCSNLYIYSKAFDVTNIIGHLGAIPGSIICDTEHYATAKVAGTLPTWFKPN